MFLEYDEEVGIDLDAKPEPEPKAEPAPKPEEPNESGWKEKLDRFEKEISEAKARAAIAETEARRLAELYERARQPEPKQPEQWQPPTDEEWAKNPTAAAERVA